MLEFRFEFELDLELCFELDFEFEFELRFRPPAAVFPFLHKGLEYLLNKYISRRGGLYSEKL